MPDGPSLSRSLTCSIAVELDGQIYVGSFTVDGSTMNVAYETRARSAHFSGPAANPDILARQILGELVDESRLELS